MILKLQNQNLFGELKQKFTGVEHDKAQRPQNGNSGIVGKKRRRSQFSDQRKLEIVREGQTSDIDISTLCKREGISEKTFENWTQRLLLENQVVSDSKVVKKKSWNQQDRFHIVIEGQTGATSIAEICRREDIDQDTFLKWSREFLNYRNRSLDDPSLRNRVREKNKELFKVSAGLEVYNYLSHYVDFSDPNGIIVLRSDSQRLKKREDVTSLTCLEKVNDIRYINKFFEKTNEMLPANGVFIGKVETFQARRQRKSINSIPIVSEIYFSLEFLTKRILPKLSWTKKYYFDITKGNDRLLSKAECLGRLVSCGFRIMDYKSIDGMLYFVVKKDKQPEYNMSPSYGPLYKMPRIGKNGKIIGVYKFRTMHPFSEYLQDYIVNANGYAETGKPADDFRIPVWGRFMRRFWLDELPQLINVIKGEMKLVGIRPLSKRYFQDIPKEMQKLRLTQKPGCIPPYVALNREGNVMSVLRSEKDYLEEKIRNPLFTDTKYFLKALFNIVIRHKRSA